jgi:hypothetical protein
MSENEHVVGVRDACAAIHREMDPLESPGKMIVDAATRGIRDHLDALAKQLAEARNDGLDLRRYATELEIALGQVSPLAKHIITDIRNECRITSEFMGENITGDLPDTEENTPCGETSS